MTWRRRSNAASATVACLALVLSGCESAAPLPTEAGSRSKPAASSAAISARPGAAPSAAGIFYVERLTGDAESEQALPMLIAVHGLGDRPESFARAVSGVPVPARLIVPRGLTEYGRGYSWFDVGDLKSPDGIRQAADRLAAAIDELVQRRPTMGRPVITGFSQGGALSFAIASLHPGKISASLPIGGWLPAELRPTEPTASAPPVFAFHGAEDHRIPVQGARDAVTALEASGYAAVIREEPGLGHSISPTMRRAWHAQIAAALGDAKKP